MSKSLGIGIIEFFEHPAILNIKTLSPSQRVTLKAIFGEPLDTETFIPNTHDYQELDHPGGFANEVELFLFLTGKDEYIPGTRYTDASLCVGRRGGKCLRAGTDVLTPNGPVKIEDLKIGDTVYGYNSDGTTSETTVKDVIYNGVKEFHAIKTNTTDIVFATKDHRFLTSTYNNPKLKEKKVGDFAAKDQYIERRFIEIPCGKVAEPHAYALGVLLGDRYAHEKTVDMDVIDTWDRISCLKFMAGLLDTDGSVKVSYDGRLDINLAMQAKPVIEAFQYLFYKLYHKKVKLRIDNREEYKNGPVHSFRLANNLYCKKFLQEVSNYIVTPRKKWKPEYADLVSRNYKEDRIEVKVSKEVVKDHAWDIEVDNETNLYVLASEGLITHNSNVIGAGVSLFKATQEDYTPYLGTSPFATIPIISPTKEQANEVYAAIKNFIMRSPYLFQQFMNGKISGFQDEWTEEDIGDGASITAKSISLNNKVVIKTLTADVSNVRGFACPFYILDEGCWFGVEGNDTKNTDKGINEAIQPATAQFGDLAFGLKISSPNGESGLMYEDYENRKDEEVLHIKAATWFFNPSIQKSYLEKQKKKGQTFFSREYGAEYTASETSYLDPNLIDDCVIKGVDALDPQRQFRYVAAIDYATKKDYWTLAIGHKEYLFDYDEKEKKEHVYIDYMFHWRGKQGAELDPSKVVPEICLAMKKYGVTYCLADHYAFAALKSLFQKEGCVLKEFKVSHQSKIKYMYSLQIAINSKSLKFPFNRTAIKHLKDLREKRTRSNLLKIEHAAGSNDDYADVIALCVYQFDKTSAVYIGTHKTDDEELPPQTQDAKGAFIATPTAEDIAEKVGISYKFNDNRAEIEERLKKEELKKQGITHDPEEEDDSGDFWFSF